MEVQGDICAKSIQDQAGREQKVPVEKEMEVKVEETLPKLSKADFRVYNRMAEHMDMFHNHFRQTWNTLYTSCTSNRRPSNMSIRQFLTMGLEFAHHLTIHHTIEERSIFPVLARKMDIFKESAELLTQHEGIHKGLEVFEKYLDDVKMGEKELDLRELKGIMDTWGAVLWTHLDAEVAALGAENMRRYWTLDEMRRMPM